MVGYRKKIRLGDTMMEEGLITAEQLDAALAAQKERGKMLGETMVDLGYVTQEQLNEVLCKHLNIDFVNMKVYEPDMTVVSLLDEKTMRKYSLVPIGYDNNNVGVIRVAMADPMNIFAMDDITIVTGKQVVPLLANASDINAFLDRAFGQQKARDFAEAYKQQQGINEDNVSEEDKARQENIENAPIVQLVRSVIEQAARQRASDIHIEPMERNIRVRYRIDGRLQEAISYDRTLLGAITARLKILAGMDISEKRKPQDGRITQMVDGREYDIRVSNLPTVYGEKVVMRLAIKEGFKREKKDLGMTDANLVVFEEILKNSHGIILVTGPTGSGKSTTLYTALSALNQEDVNIITVEDPVEANIDGINQVQVNVKAEMTFANALRSILRQDPDIIMIGEIRDGETAEIAVRASITGHLVVSTLHTNSTAASVSRLRDMGIESYLLADSLVGIIAQRLLRRLCHCKTKKLATIEEKLTLGVPTEQDIEIYEPCGCKDCNNTGYYGRIGVYEIMKISPSIRRKITDGATPDDIKELAEKEGMITLQKAANNYVLEGVTSLAEAIRATYENE